MEHAQENLNAFYKGLPHGIPIGLGYFAVAFALGIVARDIGMTPAQAFIMSAGMMASAGEYAALDLLASGAGVLEIIMTCLVVNLRYFLMSCALTQKLKDDVELVHRFALPYCISVFGWANGIVVGMKAGSILPSWAVNALSVALFGMFLSIIIPPVKKNRFIGAIVARSMACSLLFTKLPGLNKISSGFRIIILTVVIAGIAAWIRPVEDEPSDGEEVAHAS